METSTQVLRRLLDERGVKWSSIGGDTAWEDSRGWTATAEADSVDGSMAYVTAPMTPEQAIAATLGDGERDRLKAENDRLRKELDQWHSLTAGIELPEYPTATFKPKDLERENAKLREVAGKTWRLAERLCHAIEGPCQGGEDACPLGERDEECVYGLIQFELRDLGVEVDA